VTRLVVVQFVFLPTALYGSVCRTALPSPRDVNGSSLLVINTHERERRKARRTLPYLSLPHE
jgi:hypothetical protein